MKNRAQRPSIGKLRRAALEAYREANGSRFRALWEAANGERLQTSKREASNSNPQPEGSRGPATSTAAALGTVGSIATYPARTRSRPLLFPERRLGL